MADVFCDVYGVLSVGFTHLASTVNTPAYHEALKDTQEASQLTRQGK